jgi:hypothetical protein
MVRVGNNTNPKDNSFDKISTSLVGLVTIVPIIVPEAIKPIITNDISQIFNLISIFSYWILLMIFKNSHFFNKKSHSGVA